MYIILYIKLEGVKVARADERLGLWQMRERIRQKCVCGQAYTYRGYRNGLRVALRLQVCLQTAQQRDSVATLSLQGPVGVQPLHELAFSGNCEIGCDLAQSREMKRRR